MKNSIYYDFEGLLTKNALINMTLSNRGAGKTYGFTKWAIKDFFRSGKQFVYLRRYGTELKNCDKFFNAIVSNKEFVNAYCIKFTLFGPIHYSWIVFFIFYMH